MEITDSHSHDLLKNVSMLLQETNLTDVANVHVRMYQGIAHGNWNAVWMQWLDLYNIMFAGREVLQPIVPWAGWARQLGGLAALALLVAFWRRAPAAAAAARAPPAAAALAVADAVLGSAAEAADKPAQLGSSAAVEGAAAPQRLDVRPPLPTPVVASPEVAYTLHSIFEESAVKRRSELCLNMVSHRGLTYDEIQEVAERFAARMVALDDKLVGICAHRSYEIMIAIIGTLRAGKACVPVAAIGKARAATDKIAADNAWISGICCAPSAARSKLGLDGEVSQLRRHWRPDRLPQQGPGNVVLRRSVPHYARQADRGLQG
jgi:hypothetical protein